nr:uncharacterized protein LOC123493665 isoform X2 [Aegilops tauschii subsp. strangulata]
MPREAAGASATMQVQEKQRRAEATPCGEGHAASPRLEDAQPHCEPRSCLKTMAMPRRLPPLPLAVMWRVEAPEGAVDTAMHQTDGHAHRCINSIGLGLAKFSSGIILLVKSHIT